MRRDDSLDQSGANGFDQVHEFSCAIRIRVEMGYSGADVRIVHSVGRLLQYFERDRNIAEDTVCLPRPHQADTGAQACFQMTEQVFIENHWGKMFKFVHAQIQPSSQIYRRYRRFGNDPERVIK